MSGIIVFIIVVTAPVVLVLPWLNWKEGPTILAIVWGWMIGIGIAWTLIALMADEQSFWGIGLAMLISGVIYCSYNKIVYDIRNARSAPEA